MTTAGLQIKNDALTIQIDQDYKNLGLVAKGTVTTDTLLYALSPYSSYKTITLPAGVASPVIAFSCGQPCLLMNQNDTTAALLCRGAVGTSITYYIFGEMPASAPAHGAGLLVFASAGVVGYNSEYPCLRRLQSITSNASSLTGESCITASSSFTGKTVAVVQNSASFAQHTNGGSGGEGAVPATAFGAGASVQSGGTSIFINSFKVYGFNASVGWHQNGPNGAWLVIDVTGY